MNSFIVVNSPTLPPPPLPQHAANIWGLSNIHFGFSELPLSPLSSFKRHKTPQHRFSFFYGTRRYNFMGTWPILYLAFMKGPRFMRALLSNVRKRICIISQSGCHIYNFVHIMCKNGRHGHDIKKYKWL